MVVHAAPQSEPQVGRTSRVRVHKSRMGYGWDFCPRLVHQGIWRSVTHDPPPEVSLRVSLEDGIGRVHAGGELVLEIEHPSSGGRTAAVTALYSAPATGFHVGFRTVELVRRARRDACRTP